MPELTLGLEVSPHLEAAVAVSGSASVGFDKDFDVGTITLTPFAVGPLVFVPNADIIATISGKASARFSADAHANIEATTKAMLSSNPEHSSFVPFALKKVDADAETPEVDLYAEASAKAGVRLVLALYGVIGPYAQVSAGVTLIANPIEEPCWDLHVGLDTQFGVIVKTPSLPVIGAYTFLDWNTGAISLYDQSITHGSCDVTAEGAHPPPGGGPSAVTLQKPLFEPWAKLLHLPAEGADLDSYLPFPPAFPRLRPASTAVMSRAVGVHWGWSSSIWTHSDLAARSRERGRKALTSIASVASSDAGLLTLYRVGGFGAIVVAKQSQAGALLRSVRVDFPDECGASAQALAGDPLGGALLVGECSGTHSAWLVRLDRELNLTDSRQISDARCEHGSAHSSYPDSAGGRMGGHRRARAHRRSRRRSRLLSAHRPRSGADRQHCLRLPGTAVVLPDRGHPVSPPAASR